MQNVISYDKLVEKWAPVLNEESAGTIKDSHRKAVTAAILENQEIALREQGLMEGPTNSAAAGTVASGGAADNWNPVLIALVRRAMPNLMAYDIAGVQPMTGPTGLIFAMRSTYTNQAGGEAFYNEADTDFSGTGTHANALPNAAATVNLSLTFISSSYAYATSSG